MQLSRRPVWGGWGWYWLSSSSNCLRQRSSWTAIESHWLQLKIDFVSYEHVPICSSSLDWRKGYQILPSKASHRFPSLTWGWCYQLNCEYMSFIVTSQNISGCALHGSRLGRDWSMLWKMHRQEASKRSVVSEQRFISGNNVVYASFYQTC